MAAYDGTICSCVGVVFLLVALAGAQSGRMKGDDSTSLLLNTIGGIMATVGAILDRVWAFDANFCQVSIRTPSSGKQIEVGLLLPAF